MVDSKFIIKVRYGSHNAQWKVKRWSGECEMKVKSQKFLTRPWHRWTQNLYCYLLIFWLFIRTAVYAIRYTYLYLYKVVRTLPWVFVKKKGFKNQNKINVRFCTRFNDCTVQILQFREWKSGGGFAVTIYNTLRVHKWEAENSQ